MIRCHVYNGAEGCGKNHHATWLEQARKFIERIGFFNPMAAAGEETLRLDRERAQYWIGHGAQPSERVATFLKQADTKAA